MVDMSAIAGVVSSLNAAVNITKAMKDLRDWSIVQSKVIELQGVILEAQHGLFSANEERAALMEKIRDSEQKIADLEAWDAEKQRYQLTDVGEGTFAYALKAAMSNGEPAHYICANCYEQSKKSVLHHMHSPGGMHVVSCPRCSAKMGIRHGYQAPSYIQSEEERARAAARGALDPCPICNVGRMKVMKITEHPVMGAVGLQEKTIKCDATECGHTEKQMHDPAGLTKGRR
jgi:hypothetical protein